MKTRGILKQQMKSLKQGWDNLPDPRKPSNSRKYELGDIVMGAFSVFFMQSPSFLAHQTDMKKLKSCNNAESLFGIQNIPSDTHIRSVMDNIQANAFADDYDQLHHLLQQQHVYDRFKNELGTLSIALDGVSYFSSKQIHCKCCQIREDAKGQKHYSHTAVTPVLVKANSNYVLPLMPECITPQDGSEKQDCEINASKRWLEAHRRDYAAQSVTYLGDDLYAHQPICKLIADDIEQYFLFVSKPESHVFLYEEIQRFERLNMIERKTETYFNKGKRELWQFRWMSNLALRAGEDGMRVNWLELTVINPKTGETMYYNTWVTNHQINSNNLMTLGQMGRSRWQIENGSNNLLKNHGYHLEHNFGHGESHLAQTLFVMNMLAFLLHTVSELLDCAYYVIRKDLCVRYKFFQDLSALTRYICFSHWEHLFDFMAAGREVAIPDSLPIIT